MESVLEVPVSENASARKDWPRVGGVYQSLRHPNLFKSVTAISDDKVYWRWADDRPDGPVDFTPAWLFRDMQAPEEKSPLPLYEKAAELAIAALAHSVPGDCWSNGPSSGDLVQDHVVCPGCLALNALRAAALAGKDGK